MEGECRAVLTMQSAIADDLDARSAERAAQRRLEQCGYEALRHVECRFSRGTMTLTGTVPMYFHKQLAQEAVRDLRNVDVIANDITVTPW
jgi:hypothetical protein